MEKNSCNKRTKANALLCPSCCVEYVEIKFDFEVDGVILHDVKGLCCPTCREEQFTPKQVKDIEKRLNKLQNPRYFQQIHLETKFNEKSSAKRKQFF